MLLLPRETSTPIEDGGSLSGLGTAIALGVTIPLVIIALIVIACCCSRQRSKDRLAQQAADLNREMEGTGRTAHIITLPRGGQGSRLEMFPVHEPPPAYTAPNPDEQQDPPPPPPFTPNVHS